MEEKERGIYVRRGKEGEMRRERTGTKRQEGGEGKKMGNWKGMGREPVNFTGDWSLLLQKDTFPYICFKRGSSFKFL